MCLMAGTDLPMSVLVDMISSAVHLFIQLTRSSDGKRRVTYVTEVTGRDGLKVLTRDIFRFNQTGMTPEGQTMGYFTGMGYVPTFHDEFRLKGLSVAPTIYRDVKEGSPAKPVSPAPPPMRKP